MRFVAFNTVIQITHAFIHAHKHVAHRVLHAKGGQFIWPAVRVGFERTVGELRSTGEV